MFPYIFRFFKLGIPLSLLVLFWGGCGSKEKVLLEIDYSGAADWQYLLGADIYGTAVVSQDSAPQAFSGSLRTYLHGLKDGSDSSVIRFGLKDVTFIAPFLSDDEKEDIYNRLTVMQVLLSQDGISLSDTTGMPGVLSGGWDIMRCVARVVPVLPNAEMAVNSSWEREQRFSLSLPEGRGDVHLYQFFTLDSLYNNRGVLSAALSWAFNYRVSLIDDDAPSLRKYPLSGSGRGNAVLDIKKKRLFKSKANFQVAHSQNPGYELNEVVHLEAVE
ncbi:MAG: hypothetical protein LBI42_02920 [Chitinispirillales bacterium]|nr:hypothetical protein [Chitinispirillales bacterium]